MRKKFLVLNNFQSMCVFSCRQVAKGNMIATCVVQMFSKILDYFIHPIEIIGLFTDARRKRLQLCMFNQHFDRLQVQICHLYGRPFVAEGRISSTSNFDFFNKIFGGLIHQVNVPVLLQSLFRNTLQFLSPQPQNHLKAIVWHRINQLSTESPPAHFFFLDSTACLGLGLDCK